MVSSLRGLGNEAERWLLNPAREEEREQAGRRLQRRTYDHVKNNKSLAKGQTDHSRRIIIDI